MSTPWAESEQIIILGGGVDRKQTVMKVFIQASPRSLRELTLE